MHVTLAGEGRERQVTVSRAHTRRVIFVGDLVDRGPYSPDVLRIVLAAVDAGVALAVPGNHDVRFLRWLDGKPVKPTHGLDTTIAQFEAEAPGLRERVRTFISTLPSYLWLDAGRLAVAHAGIKESMLGRGSAEVRGFCLYGETSGEMDEFGLPIRYHWAAEYRGSTSIVYGPHRCPSRTGSTTRSVSTQAAASAASSRPCAGPSERLSRFRPRVSTQHPCAHSAIRP